MRRKSYITISTSRHNTFWPLLFILAALAVVTSRVSGQVTNSPEKRLSMQVDSVTKARQDSILSASFAAIALDSTNVDAYESALKVYKERRQYPSSLSLSAKMVRINPSSPSAQYLRGDAHLDNGDPESAVISFRNALLLDSRFVPVYVALAESYAMMRMNDSALVHLNAALSLNPRYAQAFLQRAVLLGQMNRLKESATDYRSAADLLPTSFEPWLKAGRAAVAAGLWDDALEALSYALKLSPSSPDALLLTAHALTGSGDSESAFHTYEDYLNHFPGSTRTHEALEGMYRAYMQER